MKYSEAVREEIKHWRVGWPCRCLLLAFAWCVQQRMDGKDVEEFYIGHRTD